MPPFHSPKKTLFKTSFFFCMFQKTGYRKSRASIRYQWMRIEECSPGSLLQMHDSKERSSFILEYSFTQISIFWKNKNVEYNWKDWILKTIRNGSKTNDFEGKMLIFCMQRFFFPSEISFYSDIYFLKK